MRNKILGWVGVLWGGLIVLTGIPRAITGDIGAGAYAVGQVTGLLFGALLLYAGIRALRASPGDGSHEQ